MRAALCCARVIETYGGSFWFSLYEPSDSGEGPDREVGATLKLYFTPGALVEAASIGIIQTVTTWKSQVPGGPADLPSYVSRHKQLQATTEQEGGVGCAIDQSDRASDGSTPNTNPVYAVENGHVGGGPRVISGALSDVRPDPAKGFGVFGRRVRREDGSFDMDDASLRDHPVRALEFAGQSWAQRFEAAALALEGPMAGVYLGSVAWGWRFDGAAVHVEPSALRLVSPGVPGELFMAAAKRWNAGESVFDWASWHRHPHVAVPIVASASLGAPPARLAAEVLSARIAAVAALLEALPEGVERANLAFERRALEAEVSARARPLRGIGAVE